MLQNNGCIIDYLTDLIVFNAIKILNGYENIDRNIFVSVKKIEGLKDMKLD